MGLVGQENNKISLGILTTAYRVLARAHRAGVAIISDPAQQGKPSLCNHLSRTQVCLNEMKLPTSCCRRET